MPEGLGPILYNNNCILKYILQRKIRRFGKITIRYIYVLLMKPTKRKTTNQAAAKDTWHTRYTMETHRILRKVSYIHSHT
jgi:hypothetical protein